MCFSSGLRLHLRSCRLFFFFSGTLEVSPGSLCRQPYSHREQAQRSASPKAANFGPSGCSWFETVLSGLPNPGPFPRKHSTFPRLPQRAVSPPTPASLRPCRGRPPTRRTAPHRTAPHRSRALSGAMAPPGGRAWEQAPRAAGGPGAARPGPGKRGFARGTGKERSRGQPVSSHVFFPERNAVPFRCLPAPGIPSFAARINPSTHVPLLGRFCLQSGGSSSP